MVDKNPTASDESQANIAEDYRLCRGVVSGDEEVGEQFYDRYHRLTEYYGRKALQGVSVTGVVDQDDMAQEAMLYALEAAKRYSADRGLRFSTFVGSYIMHTLHKERKRQRYGTRMPIEIDSMLGKIQAIDNTRIQKGATRMTDEEIADMLDVPLGPPSDVYVTVGALRQAQRLTDYMGSIDRGFNPGADMSLGDGYDWDEAHELKPISGKLPESPEDIVMAEQRRAKIDEVLDTLTARQAGIIRMRFGLDDGVPATQSECAKKYGVTAVRIRQIENDVMDKLRRPERKNKLKGLLD